MAPALFASTGLSYAAAIKADFVKNAGIAGLFEIESSKLALAQASRAEVKSFAEQMVKDHTAAAEELKAAADGK